MKKILLILTTQLFTLSLSAAAMSNCPSSLNHSITNLEGKEIDFCQYSGKVILAVNTASQCGYTPQYEGLETLYQKYKDKGFVVIGFPANNFGSQEPGSEDDIKTFCEKNYGVKFPMMAKSNVIGDDKNSIYKELKTLTGQSPGWNFHKYLLSRDGQRAYSYPSAVEPLNSRFLEQVEKLIEENI